MLIDLFSIATSYLYAFTKQFYEDNIEANRYRATSARASFNSER